MENALADEVENVRASVALVDFRSGHPALFRKLAEFGDIPVTSGRQRGRFDYLITWEHGGLCLLDTRRPNVKPFRLDFNRGARRLCGSDILRRAMGRKARTVVDATAGFGQDTVHLARLGFRVIAIERCAPIAILLAEALDRMNDQAARGLITLHVGDSVELLSSVTADAVYLDPMFAAAGRWRSLPRRRMVLAREMAGVDADSGSLLDTARSRFARVVVKRPDKSPPLKTGAHHSHIGKTVRYDVYMRSDTDPAAREMEHEAT